MEGVGLDSGVGALQIPSPTATARGSSTFLLLDCRRGIHGYELLSGMQHANTHQLMVTVLLTASWRWLAGCFLRHDRVQHFTAHDDTKALVHIRHIVRHKQESSSSDSTQRPGSEHTPNHMPWLCASRLFDQAAELKPYFYRRRNTPLQKSQCPVSSRERRHPQRALPQAAKQAPG